MFQAFGVAVAAYATFAIGQGEVLARSGAWVCNVNRDRAPGTFWAAVGCYFALALMLLFAF